LNRLLLFLRYPQPGQTKTRLIPALGATGAADLQRQIVEYLLARIDCAAWQLEIHYTGSCLDKMQDWLGDERVYYAQCEGGLGERLRFAFDGCFEKDGEGCAIAIGADCPELSLSHIKQAFDALTENDVVLGPAADGGYYLIGLSRFEGALFEKIEWSTSKVLQQTVEKAKQNELSIAKLPVLSDIDRPEDLAIWERLQRDTHCTARSHKRLKDKG